MVLDSISSWMWSKSRIVRSGWQIGISGMTPRIVKISVPNVNQKKWIVWFRSRILGNIRKWQIDGLGWVDGQNCEITGTCWDLTNPRNCALAGVISSWADVENQQIHLLLWNLGFAELCVRGWMMLEIEKSQISPRFEENEKLWESWQIDENQRFEKVDKCGCPGRNNSWGSHQIGEKLEYVGGPKSKIPGGYSWAHLMCAWTPRPCYLFAGSGFKHTWPGPNLDVRPGHGSLCEHLRARTCTRPLLIYKWIVKERWSLGPTLLDSLEEPALELLGWLRATPNKSRRRSGSRWLWPWPRNSATGHKQRISPLRSTGGGEASYHEQVTTGRRPGVACDPLDLKSRLATDLNK